MNRALLTASLVLTLPGVSAVARPSVPSLPSCVVLLPPSAAPGFAAVALAAATPQGTLGRTYTIPWRELPEDRHPRTGMLEVRSRQPVAHLSARGLTAFRDRNGVWRLETITPLVPGTPHVFRLEFRNHADDFQPQAVRWVRLVPGRILMTVF